jgi:ABC-type antimicrobial peptide transport system permease subunit
MNIAGKFWKRFPFAVENTRMALDTIRTHKGRSLLTVFGVFVAVVVLILVFSVMYGVDKNMRASMEEFGANSLFVYKFEPGIHIGRLSQEERARKPLSKAEGEAIARECPAVQKVSIEVSASNYGPSSTQFNPTARYNGKEVYGINFEGATTAYQDAQSLRVAQGRFYTDGEDERRVDVAIIGWDLADVLFPDHNAIGKQIDIGGMRFTVLGVFEKRKAVFLGDSGGDKQVVVPYESYHKHRPQDDDHFFNVLFYPGQKAQATDQITAVLRRYRHDAYRQPDSFGISSAEAISEQFRSIMSMVALLTIAVASVGLMVGGVGVMNIMLMSVTERTHEIGIRKAIGARRSDVVSQFLIEAVTLTGMGGVVGVIFSLLLVLLVNLLMPSIPAAVPLWAIGVAVAAAASVGLFFGIYPAFKAARLDPVEALRYE